VSKAICDRQLILELTMIDSVDNAYESFCNHVSVQQVMVSSNLAAGIKCVAYLLNSTTCWISQLSNSGPDECL